MSELPKWPEPIKREGPYKVYKGHQYTVYDDGNSAETPYQTDLAEAAIARLRLSVDALNKCCDDPRNVFHHAHEALAQIGPIPE